MKMKKHIKWVLSLTLLSTVIGCKSNVKQSDEKSTKKLEILIGDKRISVDNYDLKFGNVAKEKIEEGLLIVLDGLKESYESELEKNPKLRIVGDLTYTFRLEPTGLVRMLLETGVNFKDESQNILRDNFTSYLMKKQVKFPELGEMAMVETKFKYE